MVAKLVVDLGEVAEFGGGFEAVRAKPLYMNRVVCLVDGLGIDMVADKGHRDGQQAFEPQDVRMI